VDGGAADGRTAATIGAPAHRDRCCVAMHNVYILSWYAQLLAHKLRESGLLALPMGIGAGQHYHLAGGQHSHRRWLPETALKTHPARRGRRRDATDLDIGGEANSDIAPLLAKLLLLLAQGWIVDHLQCPVKRPLVVAAVVIQRANGFIWEGVGCDEV